jgi:hypothetical protein
MTRDDLMPLRARLAPPDTLDEAAERVSEVCSVAMLGLVGCVFIDVPQLEKALWECGVKVKFQLICDSGPVQTWRGEAIDRKGNTFEMWATASSARFLEVNNVRFATAALDPADIDEVKLIHDTCFPQGK